MLERLDEIDWYQYGHAYGDASDVPKMIRGLTSRKKEIREEAWGNIFGSLRHQGDIYDSTPVVVPFFIELIANPSVAAKAELIENFCYYSPDYGSWSPYYAEPGSPGDEYSLPTRKAIEEGLDAYLSNLGSPDPNVRMWTSRLLTLCFNRRDEVAETYRNRLGREKISKVRMVWVLQLAILNRTADVEFCSDVARHDADPVVRLAAALAWVHLHPQEPPDLAVEIIENLTADSNDLFAKLPQNEFAADHALDALKERNAGVRVLEKLLKSTSIEVRKKAIQDLSSLKSLPKEATSAMVGALSDPESEVRNWTAFLLGQMGESVVRGARLTAQYASLVTLETELANVAPIAVSGLSEQLDKEEDEEVRATICRALKGLALWALPALPALKAASTEYDAQKAIGIISDLHQGEASALCGLLDDGEEKIAWMAGCALVRIAHEKPQAVIPLLTKRLTSWPAAVEKAAVLLGVIGPEAHAALSALRKTLRHERQEARNAAAFALQAIDPSEPHGQQLPSDTDLARQLCLPVKHSLVKLVKTLVDDRNTTAQLQVLWKVAQMGYEAEPALPFLHEAMKKTWLHHDAAGAIARVDPEFIRPLIPELLRDFKTAKLDGDFGDRVISFLAYLGPELQPDAVEFLLSCLPVLGKKPRAAARMIPYAVQKLATTKPETLAPLINRLLQTRWEADEDILNPTTPILNLLKQSGAVYADAVDAVAGKLSSKFHAPLALETLWRIGSWTTVLPHVESLLASADPDIRAAAKECVGKLAKSAKRTDIPALQRAAEHSLPDVQQAAKSALKRMDKK